MHLFHKEIPLPELNTRAEYYNRLQEEKMLSEDAALKEELINLVKNRVFCFRKSVNYSEDKISAEITRAACRGYSKKALRGLSVFEKNRLIYRKVSDGKKLYQRCLARFIYLAVAKMEETPETRPVDKRKRGVYARELLLYHSLLAAEKKMPVSKMAEKEVLSEILAVREAIEKDKLKSLWWEEFPRIEFQTGVFSYIVRNFAYSDLERIGVRLAELNQTEDSFALAERKRMDYEVEFKTVQGDIATIYFNESVNPRKKVCISRIKRENLLKEKLLTGEELRRIPEAGKGGAATVYMEFLEAAEKKEEAVKELKKQEEPLLIKKQNKDLKLQQKEQEEMDISRRILQLQKESEDIRQKQIPAGLNDAEYERIRKIFLDNQAEIARLIKESSELEKQSKELEKERESVEKALDTLRKEICEKNKEREKLRERFRKQLESVMAGKPDGKKQPDAEYLLGRRLYEKYK